MVAGLKLFCYLCDLYFSANETPIFCDFRNAELNGERLIRITYQSYSKSITKTISVA
jgi:hypothetical protein